MLQMLRDSMKYLAWILWVVIAVFVLFVFVDFGRGNYGGSGANAPAATVAGKPITRMEFDRERQQLEERMREQLGEQFSPELAAQLQLPMQALNRLVSNRILLAEADRLGLAVSDAELRRYVVDSFRDEQGNFVGAERYRLLLRRQGYTPESFEQVARDSMVLQRLVGALRGSVVVTDEDVEESYRQQNEKTKLRYVMLPFDTAAGQAAPSEAELQRWYDLHREEYRLPEQRVADYLLVDQAKLEQSLPLTDAELRTYYQQRQQEYAQPEQLRARHILLESEQQAQAAQARLRAGEDFATVARELSTDAGSGANGGDLGWFGRGRMVPPFEQAAFGAPIGEVVGPVKSDFGYHLIEVQERRAAVTSPFEEVEQAVRMRLAAERGAQLAEEKAKTLAAEVKKAGANARQKMQELSTQPGLEIGKTEAFGRQGVVAPLGAAPAVNTAAFEMQTGGVSEPIRTPRGWLVIHLAEVKPPRVPALADVREEVRRAVEQDKRRQEAFARIEKARAEAGAGASLDSIAAKLGVAAQETPEFGRGPSVPGIGYAPELARAASTAPVGTLAGPEQVASSAVLYQVSARSGVDPVQLAQQKESLREQLEQEQVNALLTSLINQRKQELGVTYDPQLLEAIQAAGQQPPGLPRSG